MNTELNMVAAEVSFLRETLRQTEHKMAKEELEHIYRALLLSQTKLLTIEITCSSRIQDCGESIAYH